MLKPKPLANSLAAASGAFYIVFGIILLVAPQGFEYVFNAQFLGADITSLMPELTLGAYVGVLITVVITTWIFGYFWGWLYNSFAKGKK